MTAVPTVAPVTPGAPATSTWANSVEDATDFLQSPPLAFVYNAASVSLTTSTWALVLFDTEVSDAFTMHSTVSNTGRVTPNITVACTLFINAYARIAAPLTPSTANTTQSSRRINLRANSGGSDTGGTSILTAPFAPVWGAGTMCRIPTLQRYTPGDYYELFAWQDSGGTLATETGSQATGMQIWMVSL